MIGCLERDYSVIKWACSKTHLHSLLPVHHATSGIISYAYAWIQVVSLRMVYTARSSYNQRLYSTSEVRSFYILARSDTISIARSEYVVHLNDELSHSRFEVKKSLARYSPIPDFAPNLIANNLATPTPIICADVLETKHFPNCCTKP